MAKNTYKEIIEPSLVYGGIIGGVILLHTVILLILKASFSTYAQIAGNLLPIILMAWALYAYRKEYLGGYMSYSKGLGMGVMFSIVSAIIGTIYFIILVKWIDPTYMEQVNMFAEEKMLKKGMSEDIIEQSMEMTARFRTIGFTAVSSFFGGIIMGAIYSAIIMIFMKKESRDPFANVPATEQ